LGLVYVIHYQLPVVGIAVFGQPTPNIIGGGFANRSFGGCLIDRLKSRFNGGIQGEIPIGKGGSVDNKENGTLRCGDPLACDSKHL
jgi:hypothetical protein